MAFTANDFLDQNTNKYSAKDFGTNTKTKYSADTFTNNVKKSKPVTQKAGSTFANNALHDAFTKPVINKNAPHQKPNVLKQAGNAVLGELKGIGQGALKDLNYAYSLLQLPQTMGVEASREQQKNGGNPIINSLKGYGNAFKRTVQGNPASNTEFVRTGVNAVSPKANKAISKFQKQHPNIYGVASGTLDLASVADVPGLAKAANAAKDITKLQDIGKSAEAGSKALIKLNKKGGAVVKDASTATYKAEQAAKNAPKQLPSADRLLLPEKTTGTIPVAPRKLTTYEKGLLKNGIPENATPKQVNKINALNELRRQQVEAQTAGGTKLVPEQVKPSMYDQAKGQKELPFRQVQGKPSLSKSQLPTKDNTIIPNKNTVGQNGVQASTGVKISTGIEKNTNSIKQRAKNAWDSFYTNIDQTNPLRKIDEATHIKALNTASAGKISNHMFTEALVDMQGNKIGDSLQKVVKDIPKGKELDFWNYMLHNHNIDRAAEKKPIFPGYSPEQSKQIADKFKAANPEFETIGKNVTNWIDTFMKEWGVKSGLTEEEVYTELRDLYKNYIPTQRDFSQLEKGMPDAMRKQFVNNNSPIKSATGSSRNVKEPLQNIMNLVNRTVRTAKYNEVGQGLLQKVRSNPESMKGIAEIVPGNEGMFANTDNVVHVMENGKPVYLQINDKPVLNALKNLPKDTPTIPGLSHGVKGFKGLITQYNPIFAFKNTIKDMPTAYVNGSTKNPFKFAKDYGSAVKDITTNSERYQRYKGVGGGGGNFFNSGESAKAASELTGRKAITNNLGEVQGYKNVNPLLKGIKAIPHAIETVNNITETAPRLAEFNRIFDKTGDINQALHAANDVTVNFSRGGKVIKAIDRNGVPYLNAGIQGVDKFSRSFKDPKTAIATLTKAGISVTAPTIALYMVNKDNPHYQALDNRTKDTYMLIPNILGEKDSNGNAKTFIKLPKSRELSVLFSSLFERAMRQKQGDTNAWKGFASVNGNPLQGTIMTNFGPTNPIENNILSPATLNLATNKDFAGREIVPGYMLDTPMGDNRSPYLQYDDKTSQVAKKIGELTKGINGGLSPKVLDYLAKSYLGIISQYGIPATTQGTGAAKALGQQFIADPLYSNQVSQDFYDKISQLKRIAGDKNITENIPSKVNTPEEKLRSAMVAISSSVSKGNKQISQLLKGNALNKDQLIRDKKRAMLDLMSRANKANTLQEMNRIKTQAKLLFPK